MQGKVYHANYPAEHSHEPTIFHDYSPKPNRYVRCEKSSPRVAGGYVANPASDSTVSATTGSLGLTPAATVSECVTRLFATATGLVHGHDRRSHDCCRDEDNERNSRHHDPELGWLTAKTYSIKVIRKLNPK